MAVTNPARTVVDCFRYRNKVGLDVALEALAEALRTRKVTVAAVHEMASACSVRARLLRMAQEKHDSFEGLLVRYVHERLLYRLGRSEQSTGFALKGALLCSLWEQDIPRALAERTH